MKKIKISLCILFFLILLHINCFATTGIVNVTATRIRKEPNTTSEIITVIYEDDEIEILGEENEWYKINYKSNIGYVKKDFIKVKASKNENNQNITNANADMNSNTVSNNTSTDNASNNVNTNNIENNSNTADEKNSNLEDSESLNIYLPKSVTIDSKVALRLIPSFMSRIITYSEEGKEYKIVNVLNEWIQISDGNTIGWFPKSKINLGNDISNFVSNIENSNADNLNAQNTNNDSIDSKNNNSNLGQNSTNTSNNNEINNSMSNNTNSNLVAGEESKEVSNSTIPKNGKINVETARVRDGASTNSEIIDGLDYGITVEIIAENGDWYKIKSGNIEGYVSKRLISTSNNTTSRSLTESRENENKDVINDSIVDSNKNDEINNALQNVNISTNGNSVVEFAKKFLGYPYVSAGKTPETGFDCSGFTRYVFLNFGVTLGGSAASQAGVGTEVTREELSPGDLLLFYDDGKTKIGHTGIYIGNGDFIHAANPSRGVVIDNLNTNSYYNTRFITARRIGV